MADIRVTICSVDQHEGDWPTPNYPTLLLDAIAWFQGKLEQIPEEYRANARCEINSTGGYEGEHYGHIEISYDRPETVSERGERTAREEAHLAVLRAKELKALRILQTKYPNDI